MAVDNHKRYRFHSRKKKYPLSASVLMNAVGGGLFCGYAIV